VAAMMTCHDDAVSDFLDADVLLPTYRTNEQHLADGYTVETASYKY
jgi:TPP-dependent pyruvate/acetoin dehydrogenase alpha subunit